MNVPSDRRALRPDEVAKILGLSRPMGYKLVKNGTLRAIRVGRAVVVPVSEVERLLATATAEGEEEGDR